MENETNKNQMRKMTKSDYGNEKWDKSTELNKNMSIAPTERDEFTQAIHNPKGVN